MPSRSLHDVEKNLNILAYEILLKKIYHIVIIIQFSAFFSEEVGQTQDFLQGLLVDIVE